MGLIRFGLNTLLMKNLMTTENGDVQKEYRLKYLSIFQVKSLKHEWKKLIRKTNKTHQRLKSYLSFHNHIFEVIQRLCSEHFRKRIIKENIVKHIVFHYFEVHIHTDRRHILYNSRISMYYFLSFFVCD